MRTTRNVHTGSLLGVIALAALLGACNNYISPTDANPNAVPAASVDQLFTSAQLNAYFSAEDNVNRLASIWMQQMAGTDRQFSIFDTYVVKESDISTEFNDRYTGGGLIDLRRAEALASDASRPAYLGVLQVLEAYQMGMMASIWGDIPYSEAVNPDIKTPALDKQEAVYAAVQSLLDDAITNLAAGTGGPGDLDLSFGGDAAAWGAVAHTLKARYYMHWVEAQQAGSAEADVACAGNCLQKALAQTAMGIQDAAGDWRAVHSTAQTETNIWYQFMSDRSGYMSAGAFMVDLLGQRNDPRLQFDYAVNSKGQYVGSQPGQNLSDASVLNRSTTGSPTYATPIVTCAENAFIAAEASYDLNDTAGAQQALDDGIRCQEQEDGLSLTHPAGLTGTDLLNEIMTQKYFALFLNEESWNDYKRTCLPALATYQAKPIPGRLIYGEAERQTNPNVPPASQQPLRNTNDPQACSGA
jgi:starch-binding outer membrane protein, SusD/RagB family